MTIVAAIPAYNEEVHIKALIKKTQSYVDEIIVVDDASSDATAYVAKTMGVRVIIHAQNMGKAAALKTAFNEARKLNPSVLVTMYGNGWHNAEDIPALVHPILWDEADIVNGSHSSTISMTADVEERVVLMDPVGGDDEELCEIYDRYTGFRAYSAKTFDAFKFKELGDGIESEMLDEAIASGYRIKQVPINMKAPWNMDILSKYSIGVVVPAYNEEKLITDTVNSVPPYVNRIYIINDASTDNTAQVIESLNDPRIHLITHEVNQGVGAALVNGYKQALKENMDIVAVMAGDNQMNPDQLPKLLMPIIEGKTDYTKGNRLLSAEFRGGMSGLRLFGNSMLTMITKIGSGYWHLMDPQNGYTAISREALENIGLDEIYTYYGYCNHMLVRLNAFGFRTMDIPMPSRYGEEKSTINYGPYMIKVSLMLFRSFLWRLEMKYMILSFHPLVLFYIFAMTMLPVGLVFGFSIVSAKIAGLPVSANYPLLDALMLITGVQFLLFAMMFDMQESDKDMREGSRLSQQYYQDY
ncbi:MAG: glycosyltransferase family 2 protein [Thermodesulfobacteriota bacterium]|nr:glycosyltransferase family 2 protein [Thermodesulfobacteriota bacterium]